MKIYNLFPPLAGQLSDWQPHLTRAAELGFDWIFVNPIQKLGESGSLYSIADYFQINPNWLDPDSKDSPEQQVRATIQSAEKLGLRFMVDLVINHCAVDASLVKEHPGWFIKDKHGNIVNPSCTHDNQKVVWRDLAQFNHKNAEDQEGLFQLFSDIVSYLIELGFKGFRCDAAYQIPTKTWRRLIERIKSKHPDVVFAAETLGCSAKQTKETARSGFDYIFNSSKWWDFSGPWLLEQYELTRDIAPSISFPESHDTDRLFQESGGNINAMKQRYLFSALFSSGIMMPMGFEYGLKKSLHVVKTRPDEWLPGEIDLTDFIKQVNQIKSNHPIFQEESITEVISCENPAILLMWKAAKQTNDEALIILNKDPWNPQSFHSNDLYQYIQAEPPLIDVSPEWPMDYLPQPFHYDLPPGTGRVLVTQHDI